MNYSRVFLYYLYNIKKSNMRKRVYDSEQLRIKEMQKYYESQKNKVFNYTLDDFEIYDSQWKHKDWKTWCKGCGRYDHTKQLVERYISECKKPYGTRNFEFVHLIKD